MKRTKQLVVLMMSVMLITSGCGKDDDPVAPVVAPTTSNNGGTQTGMSLGGFVCELDGNKFEMIVKSTNNISGDVGVNKSVNSSVSPVVTTKSYDSSVGDQVTGESAGIEIGKIEYSGSVNADYALFKSLFIAENKVYYNGSGIVDEVRVSMVYNGDIWDTTLGTADQSGSSFTITKVTEKELLGTKYVNIEATFSCTLYDFNGNTMQLTNGVYVGSFENI